MNKTPRIAQISGFMQSAALFSQAPAQLSGALLMAP
jgi:hypothetical protein